MDTSLRSITCLCPSPRLPDCFNVYFQIQFVATVGPRALASDWQIASKIVSVGCPVANDTQVARFLNYR